MRAGQVGRNFQRAFDGHVINAGGQDTLEVTLHIDSREQ